MHFYFCATLPLQTKLRKTQTQFQKFHKRNCTAFQKLMCVWTQPSASLEETFRLLEEAFQFAAQLHIWKKCSECWHHFFDVYRSHKATEFKHCPVGRWVSTYHLYHLPLCHYSPSLFLLSTFACPFLLPPPPPTRTLSPMFPIPLPLYLLHRSCTMTIMLRQVPCLPLSQDSQSIMRSLMWTTRVLNACGFWMRSLLTLTSCSLKNCSTALRR